ncbi:MAG: NlpC/P60 family protein [Planctomycetaceae bacterium]|nr:NlpC/P60 family protein [Planctomycetaceae bacterium]
MFKCLGLLAVVISLFFITNCSAVDVPDVNYGIICVPAANLRGAATHETELYDQEIMGYPVKLLQKQDNWYQVQMEYGYVGWMNEKSFVQVNAVQLIHWKNSPKVRVTKVFGFVYSKPDTSSQPVTNVVMNVLLKKGEKVNNKWLKVETPDGRAGFLQKQDCVDAVAKELSKEEMSKSIVETAKMMMGVPYLWGGKSSVSCDCSGLTSTVFRAHGIAIGRDSCKQATEGKAVDINDFTKVQPGDLIFFGKESISHVAISLGGKDFIHQSGCVHITSLDPNSPYYEESYGKKLKVIRRFF